MQSQAFSGSGEHRRRSGDTLGSTSPPSLRGPPAKTPLAAPGLQADPNRLRGLATKEESPEILTIPTVLTLMRLALVPAVIPAFYMLPAAAVSIFLLAAATDWLDGFLARKLQSHSEFGAFLDPVADKLMVAAVLVLICTEEPRLPGLPVWSLALPAIAIICREVAMSAVREWAASQGPSLRDVVAVSGLGKWKTATQMAALSLLLIARLPFDDNAGLFVFFPAVGTGLLYVSCALALFSFGAYLRSIFRMIKLGSRK